jgi:hypothetical protein
VGDYQNDRAKRKYTNRINKENIYNNINIANDNQSFAENTNEEENLKTISSIREEIKKSFDIGSARERRKQLKRVNGDTEKSGKQEDLGDKINIVITAFKKVNPAYDILYSNNTQRKAVERLIKRFGFEKLIKLVDALPLIVSKPYAPIITSPLQLEKKLGDLMMFLAKEKNKPPLIAKLEQDGSELNDN